MYPTLFTQFRLGAALAASEVQAKVPRMAIPDPMTVQAMTLKTNDETTIIIAWPCSRPTTDTDAAK
jgi:hypothetical protein